MKFPVFPALVWAASTLGAISLCAQAAPVPNAPTSLWASDPAVLSPQDARLLKVVTLEARRLPLPEFVRQLSEKSGARVRVPETTSTRLVSAHFNAASLLEVLRGLSRLYGLEWSVSPNGYTAREAARELEKKWLQLGNIGETQMRHINREDAKNLTAQALAGADMAALQGKEGVLLSTQPQLAAALRAERETLSALRLLESWGKAMPWTLQNSFLRVEVPRPQPNTANSAPRLALFDANGQRLATLGTMTQTVPSQTQK